MLRLLTFPRLLAEPRLRHGVSPPRDLAGQPFSLRWVDDGAGARQNRARLVAALNDGRPTFDPARLIVPQQTHSTRVAVVTADTPIAPGALADTDAVCTATAGLALLVLSADCGMVLVYDPGVPAVGLAHAGWRGAAGGIVSGLVATLRSALGAVPGRCRAAISPCAGGQAYEVGPEVAAAFAGRPGADVGLRPAPNAGKFLLDLPALLAADLRAAGVPAERIETAGVCTITDPAGWFSHRREGPGTGRFGLIAGLAPPA